jgi:hypothetical protein
MERRGLLKGNVRDEKPYIDHGSVVLFEPVAAFAAFVIEGGRGNEGHDYHRRRRCLRSPLFSAVWIPIIASPTILE